MLVGLASSGLHANGYSLVRHALLTRHRLDDTPPELRGRTVADELLEPCVIYVNRVLSLARDDLVHAAAHITGGGFHENVPRAMPEGLGAEIQRGTWPEQPVFSLVRAAAGDSVTKGQPLLVLEAMKMEHTIAASHDGVIADIVAEGVQVTDGVVLVRFVEVDAA